MVSREGDGLWKASGGFVTQYGVFAIAQSFDTRDQFTYLILRDRAKGTDQVFKLATKGYVELHTIGEHRIRLEREENKLIVDVETTSGTIAFDVYPDSQAVTRIELGHDQPDFVFFTDKRLAVEYDSYIWSDASIQLDSIQTVTYQKTFGNRSLIFDLKPEITDHPPQPFVVKLTDIPTADKNVLALESALAQFAPKVTLQRTIITTYAQFLWLLVFLTGAVMIGAGTVVIYNSFRKKLGWTLLALLPFCGFALIVVLLSIILNIDWEVAHAAFQ
jgi:hypothetical protein